MYYDLVKCMRYGFYIIVLWFERVNKVWMDYTSIKVVDICQLMYINDFIKVVMLVSRHDVGHVNKNNNIDNNDYNNNNKIII